MLGLGFQGVFLRDSSMGAKSRLGKISAVGSPVYVTLK